MHIFNRVSTIFKHNSNWLKNKSSSGITLLEVTLVLFLFVTILGISLPRLTFLFETSLQRQSKQFATLLRTLRMESILQDTRIRLEINPEKEKFFILCENKNKIGEFIKCAKFKEETTFEDPVKVEKITTGFENVETYDIAPVQIFFEPIGITDICSVYLTDSEKIIKISISNLSGKIDISAEEDI